MNRIRGIKAISFDGDGTLWDFEKLTRHSLHHALMELERIDPEAAAMLDVETMVRIRDGVATELKESTVNLEHIRLEAFRQTLKDIGRPNDALASHLNQVYFEHRFEDLELFDDVLPSFEVLRAKYTLGLLSNGNSYPEHCGLQGVFQFVVFSQDYGVAKPAAGLFQVALDKAGCSRHELLHVGDSLEDDVGGAKNAGIKCVWLNRKRAKNNLDAKMDYEISSLLEVLEIL